MTGLDRLAEQAVEWGAMQIASELACLGAAIVDRIGAPQTVLEIGSCTGGTLWFFSQLATSDALLISLDTNQHHNRTTGRDQQTVCKLQIDSGDHANYQWIAQCPSVDLLFIDGDHALTAIERDYRTYRPLVRDGGLIAFHDVGFPCGPVWQRLRSEGSWSDEFIHPNPNHGHSLGIGVMCVGCVG